MIYSEDLEHGKQVEIVNIGQNKACGFSLTTAKVLGIS